MKIERPDGTIRNYQRLRAKGGYLYFRVKDINGWRWLSTAPDAQTPGLPVGREADAERIRVAYQNDLDTTRKLGLRQASRVTVETFFNLTMDESERTHSVSALELKHKRQRFKDYCQPLAKLQIQAVKYHHISTWNAGLKGQVDRGEMSSRLALHIVAIISQLFRHAVRMELIAASPCDLERKEKIKKRDMDPLWRDSAYFEIPELEQLISDERIEFGDRLSWAACFFLACRPTEMERLTWGAYKPEVAPMPKMLVVRTKTGAVSHCPVHPTLAGMLAEWKLTGWAEQMGRKPAPEDLIFPVFRHLSSHPQNRPTGTVRGPNYTWRRMQMSFEAIGIRHRRVYDFRRSLITLGVNEFDCTEPILKSMTHTSTSSDAFDLYKSKNYRVLCREIAKIQVVRRSRAELISLPIAVNASEGGHVPSVGLEENSAIISNHLAMGEEGIEPRTSEGNQGKSEEIVAPNVAEENESPGLRVPMGELIALKKPGKSPKVTSTMLAAVARLEAGLFTIPEAMRRDLRYLLRVLKAGVAR